MSSTNKKAALGRRAAGAASAMGAFLALGMSPMAAAPAAHADVDFDFLGDLSALFDGSAFHVDAVDGDALAPALELAAALAQGPAAALALAKRAVDGGLDGTLSDGLRLEQRLFVDSFATGDAAVGVRSFLRDGPGKAQFP